MNTQENFGEMIRRLREEAKISLRSFAAMVEKTPTYISKIERNELNPPAEPVIKEMARILRQNEDALITLAGKIPSDLPDIIKQKPREMALMLRTATRLTSEQLQEITDHIANLSEKNEGK